MIKTGKIKSCYASDDGSALHFKDGKLLQSVEFCNQSKSYEVKLKSGKIIEKIIKGIKI